MRIAYHSYRSLHIHLSFIYSHLKRRCDARSRPLIIHIIDVTSGVRILLNIYTLVAEVQELYRFNTSVKLNADQMDTK